MLAESPTNNHRQYGSIADLEPVPFYNLYRHVRPAARSWLVGNEAVLIHLYCHLWEGLVRSHCCSPHKLSYPYGPLRMQMRCLLRFGKQHTLACSTSLVGHGIEGRHVDSSAEFRSARPKRCGVRYAAVHRGHVPSTFATLCGLQPFRRLTQGFPCMNDHLHIAISMAYGRWSGSLERPLKEMKCGPLLANCYAEINLYRARAGVQQHNRT